MKKKTNAAETKACVAGYDIKEFLTYLDTDGKSNHTKAAYKTDLKQFAKYLETAFKGTGKKIQDVSLVDLQGWVKTLSEMAPASIVRKKATLKTFFSYLYNMEVISKNPAEKLSKTKIPVKMPRIISGEEGLDLLRYFRKASESGSFISLRNHAIVATFLYTGIRREELINIKLEDIRNLESDSVYDRWLLIHGKGNKEREIAIPPILQSILVEYIKEHRRMCRYASKSTYLFVSNGSEKLTTRTVDSIVNKGLEKIGIDRFAGIDRTTGIKKGQKGLSAHVLRKCFATAYYKKSKDIVEVSRVLGHSSVEVTMRYVGYDKEKRCNTANNFDLI